MYSKNAIRIYSLLISIVITLSVRQCSIKIAKVSNNVKDQKVIQEVDTIKNAENYEEVKEVAESVEELNNETQKIDKTETSKEIWQLMIPKIDLIAPISEGTDQPTMKKTIGHFVRNGYMGREYRTCST